MPLAPNLIERFLFLTLNQAPGPILDLWSGPASRTVLAAIRLNCFEALEKQPATADELAKRLNTNPRGTGILLGTLTALGYVTHRQGQYHLSPMARKWLTNADTTGINFSAYFQFWGIVLEKFFPTLEESLRTGQPPVNLYTWLETQPEASRYFQEGLMAITRYIKDDVARAIPVSPGPQRLLDVGGGHALYSIALCQKHPQLSAVIFDSSQAIRTGQATIAAEQMADRVTTQAGNFFADDFGSGFDVALLFNIVHGLSAEQNLALLRKTKAALNPGGRVVIAEQISGGAPLPLQEATVRILGLSYFHLLGGQTYTFEDIRGWLMAAGFDRIRRKDILKVGSPLIMAH